MNTTFLFSNDVINTILSLFLGVPLVIFPIIILYRHHKDLLFIFCMLLLQINDHNFHTSFVFSIFYLLFLTCFSHLFWFSSGYATGTRIEKSLITFSYSFSFLWQHDSLRSQNWKMYQILKILHVWTLDNHDHYDFIILFIECF